jgi:hypothetical protein
MLQKIEKGQLPRCPEVLAKKYQNVCTERLKETVTAQNGLNWNVAKK